MHDRCGGELDLIVPTLRRGDHFEPAHLDSPGDKFRENLLTAALRRTRVIMTELEPASHAMIFHVPIFLVRRTDAG